MKIKSERNFAPYYPSRVNLPRLGRNKSINALELNRAIELIEKALKCRPIYQCAACGEPKCLHHDHQPFAGICDDCWMHNENVADMEFCPRHHAELRRVWKGRYLGMKSELATGNDRSSIRSALHRCPDWLFLCGIESAFGAEIISDVIGERYISPNALRWNSELGLIPSCSVDLPSVGDFKGWRDLWANAWKYGNRFSSIVVGKSREAKCQLNRALREGGAR
jgi:hypothetical protein